MRDAKKYYEKWKEKENKTNNSNSHKMWKTSGEKFFPDSFFFVSHSKGCVHYSRHFHVPGNRGMHRWNFSHIYSMHGIPSRQFKIFLFWFNLRAAAIIRLMKFSYFLYQNKWKTNNNCFSGLFADNWLRYIFSIIFWIFHAHSSRRWRVVEQCVYISRNNTVI